MTGKFFMAADRVVEVGVATIDDRVALCKERDQLINHRFGCIAAWHHHPHAARSLKLADELLYGVRWNRTLFCNLVGLFA